MNVTSPLLLGGPFIDKYVELIQIRKHYFVLYTTPREIRELHDDDEAYFGGLLQVPYIVSSHEIVLDDTAKVHQVLYINATHASEQDPPQTPTATIEENDEAKLSVELAQTSLHPSQESSSPWPDVPTTQLTPSQELVVDELQRQVDARDGNVDDMGAGPSNWDQPASPRSPNGRPCKAPKGSPSSPDTRCHLFRASRPATRLSPVAHGTPPAQGSPRPQSRSPAPPEYDPPETLLGRLISNPSLLHFLVHDIPADGRLALILRDASADRHNHQQPRGRTSVPPSADPPSLHRPGDEQCATMGPRLHRVPSSLGNRQPRQHRPPQPPQWVPRAAVLRDIHEAPHPH